MSKFANYGICLLVGVAIGFASALWMRSLSSAHEQVDEAKSTATATIKASDEANRQEVNITDRLTKVAKDGEKIKDAVLGRIEANSENLNNVPDDRRVEATTNADRVSEVVKPKPNTCPTPKPVEVCRYMPFDVGTVRLLNAARTGAAIDSVSLSDPESRAFAAVTVTEFVGNDTEIARMYNELALRHNLLVDQVVRYQNEQRKRLGLKE